MSTFRLKPRGLLAMNTGKFQNGFLWEERRQKNIYRPFSPTPSFFVSPPSHFFFYLFHTAVLGNAAAVFKQLSHTHQRTCEAQPHSVRSRSVWFSSACAPTCSLEVCFIGLGSDLGQQSCLHAAHTVLEPWLRDRMLLQRTRDSKILKCWG